MRAAYGCDRTEARRQSDRRFSSPWARASKRSKSPTLHFATIANAVIYYNEFWAAHKSDAAWVLKNGAAQRRARSIWHTHELRRLYPSAADAQPLCARNSPSLQQSGLSRLAVSSGTRAAGERRWAHRYVVQACCNRNITARSISPGCRPCRCPAASRIIIYPSRCSSSASPLMNDHFASGLYVSAAAAVV